MGCRDRGNLKAFDICSVMNDEEDLVSRKAMISAETPLGDVTTILQVISRDPDLSAITALWNSITLGALGELR